MSRWGNPGGVHIKREYDAGVKVEEDQEWESGFFGVPEAENEEGGGWKKEDDAESRTERGDTDQQPETRDGAIFADDVSYAVTMLREEGRPADAADLESAFEKVQKFMGFFAAGTLQDVSEEIVHQGHRISRPYSCAVPQKYGRLDMRNKDRRTPSSRSAPYTTARAANRGGDTGFSNKKARSSSRGGGTSSSTWQVPPTFISYHLPIPTCVEIMREIKRYIRGTFKFLFTTAYWIHIDRHGEWLRLVTSETSINRPDSCIERLTPAAKRITEHAKTPVFRMSAKVTIEIILYLKARERLKMFHPRCTSRKCNSQNSSEHTRILIMSASDLKELIQLLEIKSDDWGYDERLDVKLKPHAVARLEAVCRALL